MADLFSKTETQAANNRCLGCGGTHADAHTVTLVDGSTACNYSEAWRLECQARALLARPLQTRRWQIDEIERREGVEAADAIRFQLDSIWAQRQNQKLRG